jgi:nucleoside-diphosphate-sugar epimerase
MKVLIIGGSRFIGKAVATQLSAKGHDGVLFNRGKTRTDLPYRTLVGDVDNLQIHKTILLEVGADVVIHAIAYTGKHASDAVEVFSGSNTRVVVLSSQDCYEAFYQLNQGRDVADLPLSEEAELCKQQYYWRNHPGTRAYEDYDKNLVTSVFLSAHAQGRLSSSLLRLPMVFGPEDFQFRHRHGKIIRRIFDRRPLLLLGAVEQSSLP